MAKAGLAIGGFLLLAGALPAAFAAQPAAAPATPDPRAEAHRALDTVPLGRLFDDPAYAREILRHLDVVAPTFTPTERGLHYEGLRVAALAAAGRAAEARGLSDRVLQHDPKDPIHYVGAWMLAEPGPDERQHRASIIERASRNVPEAQWPALRDVFDAETVFQLYHFLGQGPDKSGQVRLAEALARIGWPGPHDPESVGTFRIAAIDGRLKAGDRAAAAALAADMPAIGDAAGLILTRKYDGLIGDVEPLEYLRRAVEAQDRATARALLEDPADMERVGRRADFLRADNRPAEAVALLAPYTRDVPRTVGLGQYGMWIINSAAHSLVDIGRFDEAVALMRPLAAMDLRSNPELISPMINFTDLLWRAGRAEESLALAQRLERDFPGYASVYGRMWIMAGLACSHASLGRPEEARGWAARMQAHKEENRPALFRAQLCAGDMAGAEALMIERLRSDDARGAILELQDWPAASLPQGPDAILYRRLAELKARPPLAAAFDQVGRKLPLPLSGRYWGAL